VVDTADCLVVTPRWNPDGGGRERYAAELVTALARHRVTTTILTLEDERATERAIAAWRNGRSQAPVLALEAVRGATHYQLHSGLLGDSFAAEGRSFPSRLRRAGAGIGLRLNLRRQRRLRREREVLMDPAAKVWAFSHRDGAAVRERFRSTCDRVTIGRPGIDLLVYSPPAHRNASRVVRALFVGHNFQLKGLAVALQALALAGHEGTLTIAGGDNPAYWRRLASRLGVADRVRFVGAVPTDVMVSLYRESDVLLHPAVHDPSPRVVLEALACGCPVITTPTCGTSEVLSEGEDGWVIEGANVAGQIARRLADLSDVDVRRAMSARAAQTGRQFDFETHVREVIAWVSCPPPAALHARPDPPRLDPAHTRLPPGGR
jgi:glycosyltransferase involved in cell wall biosynthesis